MEQPNNPTACESSATPQHTSEPPPRYAVLESGELIFRVRRPDGSETDHQIDLLSLKLTCEETEQVHNLQVKDGAIAPTAAFLADLAARFVELGVADCTPTIAYQMWLSSYGAMETLKNALSGMPS